MAAQGAAVLFVPTNNGLPPGKGGPELASETRNVDIARATSNNAWVVRADVAGRAPGLVAHGTSAIVGPDGTVLASVAPGDELIVAEIRPSRVL